MFYKEDIFKHTKELDNVDIICPLCSKSVYFDGYNDYEKISFEKYGVCFNCKKNQK